MDGLAKARVRLALRVLSSRYDLTVSVTDAEVETLKSYFHDDSAGMRVEDIAAAVIHGELNGQRTDRVAKIA